MINIAVKITFLISWIFVATKFLIKAHKLNDCLYQYIFNLRKRGCIRSLSSSRDEDENEIQDQQTEISVDGII